MENLLQFAMNNYDNPGCKTIEEFTEDYQKFTLIKKMLKKDNQNIKLVLNHLVILFNVFKSEACIKLLFEKIEKEKWEDLKTYLVFLNYMPDVVPTDGTRSSSIMLNQQIIDELRRI